MLGNYRSRVPLVFIAAALLAAGAGTSRASLLLDDPLQAATLGVRSGGAFVADGWQVTGQTDSIYWHVPTIANGKVYVGTQSEISVYAVLP